MAVVGAHFMPQLTKKMGEQKVPALAFIGYGASFAFFLQTGTALLVIGAVFSGIGLVLASHY